MKLAIQGHPTRGKEVIQILESLGGKNENELEGICKTFYYINDENEIWDTRKKNFPPIYKLYTLEEFEKEFPFKIGDKVVCKENLYALHTIIGISYNSSSCLQYEIKEDKTGIIVHYPTDLLIKYNEMKEERNITLTLDKAKEWYNKGGELREIALQAFSEKELNPLPRSWEEFCKKYPVKDKEAHFDSLSSIVVHKDISQLRSIGRDRNICPSQKSAEAHLAMIQLEQLRNCWWNGWEPIWDISQKYCIYLSHNEVQVRMCTNVARFLTFPTREMAIEFLECFRDLIELARNLI